MLTIAYASKETWPMTKPELLLLLQQCRSLNAQHGITGLLVYECGYFIQVIEGEENKIEKLYSNIKNDRRNKNVTTLVHKEINNRAFEGWSMGFANVTKQEQENLPAFSKFFEPTFKFDNLAQQHAEIFELLLEFKNNSSLEKIVGH
mgnify:FL=1|tara:strand:- start:2228 stop:2668 length:441 start_codon:yes stop_codon:yes gene_type:complete